MVEIEFYNAIKGFFVKRTPSIQVAEDLTQEVFLKIRKSSREEDIHSIKSWLFTVAKNTLIDYYRRKSKLGVETSSLEEFDESGVGIEWEEAEDDLNVITSCALNMMNKLDLKDRVLIQKVYIDGISQKELANEMGINYSTLKSRSQKSLSNLKHELFNCCSFKKDRRGRTFECELNKKKC